MTLRRIALAVVLPLAAAACTTLPPPEAGFDQVRAVQAADVAPMRVGDFGLAPGVPKSTDVQVVVRAEGMAAPGGSFSKYLADALAADLRAAGRYDPSSTLVVSGLLAESHVDSVVPTAHARLGADFTLVRDGKTAFKKRLQVSADWESDWMGAVAIPEAMNHYTALYQKLVSALLADPDFRAAAKR